MWHVTHMIPSQTHINLVRYLNSLFTFIIMAKTKWFWFQRRKKRNKKKNKIDFSNDMDTYGGNAQFFLYSNYN